MRIGLSQGNLEKGHDMLMEVSHPESPKYGKYYTAEEIHDIFAPADEAVQAVKEWLYSFGIDKSRVVHSENKGWIAFDASVEEAESLLKAEYFEHEHKSSSKIRVGCDEYHVPEHLSSHIDYITPGLKLTPVVKRTVKNKRSTQVSKKLKNGPKKASNHNYDYKCPAATKLPVDLQGCGVNITVACWKALYGIPDKLPKATKSDSLGLFEQGDYFAESDIDKYLAEFAPYVPQGTYPLSATIDGADFSEPANNTDLVGGEANIDIDIAIALIYPQTTTLYQTDDQIYSPAEVADVNTFNTFLDAIDGSYCTYTAYGETGDDASIDPVYPNPNPSGYQGKLQCGVFKPTNVISASYGEAEVDLPANYVKRQCNEFMKLGLQGVSMLFASGDYGVASFPGDPTSNGCLGPEKKIFNPQYPSGCPYVTSVGGTMIYADQTVYDAESVMQVNLGGSATNFSSSGGFSNYFPQPNYQKSAVATYFKEGKPSYPYYSELNANLSTVSGLYNRVGRGYPDVASNGAYMPAYVNGKLGHWFGASLASPTFASILTLLNEERAAVGKGPIGFVNSVLYAHPEVLNDIVNGTNLGCNSAGFQAVKGWDPVTGLGTANYPKMKSLFLSLP